MPPRERDDEGKFIRRADDAGVIEVPDGTRICKWLILILFFLP